MKWNNKMLSIAMSCPVYVIRDVLNINLKKRHKPNRFSRIFFMFI